VSVWQIINGSLDGRLCFKVINIILGNLVSVWQIINGSLDGRLCFKVINIILV